MDLGKYIDGYDIKARVAPALILIFPLLFSIWVWFPITQTWTNALSGTVFAIFFAWLLGRVARDKGVLAQERLFRKWGGNVAERMLRWEDTYLNELDKARYHKILRKNIEGLSLPSADEEALSGEGSNQQYAVAIGWLRRKTRDEKRFFLVFKENVNYGFHRNLYGLKGLAITAYVLLAATNFVLFLKGEAWGIQDHMINSTSSMAVSCVSLLVWAFFITEDSVKSAAIAYSERLIEALEEFD